MNLDLSSIINFLLVYFLFCLVQYLVGLMESIFDLIAAYLACKLVEYQGKLDVSKEKEEETTCIGFQAPVTDDEEDDDDED